MEATPIMQSIKEKRESLNLTQQQFAELTGIPFRTIQNWETGKRKCPDYVLKFLFFYIDHNKNLFKKRSKQ